MMDAEFSKAALRIYLDTAQAQGLVNQNTLAGWKSAYTKVLEDVPDTTDVRTVDLKTQIRRYNNSHPGVLSPASLQAYEKRLAVVIEEFTKYQTDPAAYKGRGRNPTAPGAPKRTDTKITPKTGFANIQEGPDGVAAAARVIVTSGLSLEFPMRTDFLAQVVVPRDMKHAEAVRFTRFIMALAQDPEVGAPK
jgi:hypothetical protein